MGTTKYYIESSALLQEPDLIEKLEGPVYIHELGLRYLSFLKKSDNPELLSLKEKAILAERYLQKNFRKVRVLSSSMSEINPDCENPEGYLLVKKIVENSDANKKKTILVTNIYSTKLLAEENGIKVKTPYQVKKKVFIRLTILTSILACFAAVIGKEITGIELLDGVATFLSGMVLIFLVYFFSPWFKPGYYYDSSFHNVAVKSGEDFDDDIIHSPAYDWHPANVFYNLFDDD